MVIDPADLSTVLFDLVIRRGGLTNLGSKKAGKSSPVALQDHICECFKNSTPLSFHVTLYLQSVTIHHKHCTGTLMEASAVMRALCCGEQGAELEDKAFNLSTVDLWSNYHLRS